MNTYSVEPTVVNEETLAVVDHRVLRARVIQDLCRVIRDLLANGVWQATYSIVSSDPYEPELCAPEGLTKPYKISTSELPTSWPPRPLQTMAVTVSYNEEIGHPKKGRHLPPERSAKVSRLIGPTDWTTTMVFLFTLATFWTRAAPLCHASRSLRSVRSWVFHCQRYTGIANLHWHPPQ